MITAKQAARLRHKLKTAGKLSAANAAKLAEYDASKGRTTPDQQSPVETPGDGGTGQPAPRIDSSPDPVPPADTTPQPPPSVEAPPPVRDAPAVAAAGAPKATGDWRDKWRAQIHYSGDGRQMLCESIGSSIVEGLGALRDETSKVTTPKTPDPRAMAGLFILALDELLPERAKLTPKIGAAALMVGTIGERYYHAKKIEEFLKTDPDHREWLRKQAERERAEQTQRAQHEAEVAAASSPPQQPQYAEPPQPDAPAEHNGTSVIANPGPRSATVPAPKIDPDDPSLLC